MRCGRLLLEESSEPEGTLRQFRVMFQSLADFVGRLAGWQAGSESSSSNHQHTTVRYERYIPKCSTWAQPIHCSSVALGTRKLPMIHPQADRVELSQALSQGQRNHQLRGCAAGRGKAHDAPPICGPQESRRAACV